MRLGSEKKSWCRYSVKEVDQSQWDFMLPTMHLDNIITSIHNLVLKYPNKKTRLSESIVFFLLNVTQGKHIRKQVSC